MQSVLKVVEDYMSVHPEIDNITITAKAYPCNMNAAYAEVKATVVSKFTLEAAPF